MTAIATKSRSRVDAPIPLVDLHAQYQGIRDEVGRALLDVADSAHYVLGPRVQAFEEDFARYAGVRNCVAVNSGTSALHLALVCAGVGRDDEVITVPMTFIATSWAISYRGATPVFVDVDPVTCTMDVTQVEAAITPRTRAILPVHLYGQSADLAPLLALGKRHDIPIIEDAAQAHGAEYHGRRVGGFGMCGCYSFYPGKNLGAYGEGGAVVTNDDAIAERMRALRDHAQSRRYHHDEIGYNYRMDAMQGAILGIKLKHIERWTERRRDLAARYDTLLCSLPIALPVEVAERRHVWHLYVVRHPKRDYLKAALESRGIATGLHYPVPLHLQTAYCSLGYDEGEFPVSEKIANECLTLPLYSEMTLEQQDRVVEALANAIREVE